jgi:hypothetical protein
MGQIAPAASSIPGHGTSGLPRVTEPSMTHPCLILSEPRQDSCDGMAGTQGWTEVTVRRSSTPIRNRHRWGMRWGSSSPRSDE